MLRFTFDVSALGSASDVVIHVSIIETGAAESDRFRSGTLRGAVFHNARSLRCAQNAFAKHLKAARISRRPSPRVASPTRVASPRHHQ